MKPVSEWNDARYTKPPQGVDVMLWLSDGSISKGRYLENANKYHMHVRRWKVYSLNKYVSRDKVIAWSEI